MEQLPAVADTLVVRDEMWELVKDLERGAVSEPARRGPRTADLLDRLLRQGRRDLGARPIHINFSAHHASEPN
ncbi:hypothetical protein [Streptomyces mutabilis]|uniref:hypothetical protein n=1 Tax=Streptomyces mutabilis TaxID=67332 RepID=UPI00367B661F